MRILYVDDEPMILELAQSFLEAEGDVNVVTCTSAMSALGLLSSGRFDAIVSDYQMPGMDGIEFLKTLRSRWPSMPFILFTGRGREEVAMEALRHGADSYIMKGGDAASQFKMLSNEVRLAAARREAEEAVHYNLSRFNLIMGNVSDVIMIIGEDGLIHYISPSIKEALGYTREELLGQSIGDLDYLYAGEPNKENPRAKLMKSLSDHGTIYSLKAKDGSIKKALVKSTMARQGDETVMIATLKDVTRIVEMEEMLSSRERLFTSVLNHMPIASGITDALSGEIIHLNKKAMDVLGLPQGEAVEGTIAEFNIREKATGGSPFAALVPGKMAFGVEVEIGTKGGSRQRYLINAAKISLEDRLFVFFMVLGKVVDGMPANAPFGGDFGKYL